MTDDEILAAFQKTVRRLDNWRGYFGDDEDSPTDDEVHEALQRARDALEQRAAVLALHKPAKDGGGRYPMCSTCGELHCCSKDWPCPTVRALGVTE